MAEASPRGPSRRLVRLAADYILFAIVCGIATGVAEVVILLLREAVFGRMIFASRHVVWMAPAAYALLFNVLGILLFLGAMLAPRVVTYRVRTVCCIGFGVFCLFLPFTQIHRLAALLVALGVAVQTSRVLAGPGRVERLNVLLPRVTAVAAAVLAATMLGVRAWEGARERRAVAGLPAAAAGRPNVLIIIWDTVRATSLGLYGHPHPTTPTLERMASQGVVFDWAISTSPWTLPSHGSMFTGRFPHELSADWFSALDDTYPTLAEVLGAHGYLTGGFTANVHYTSARAGMARGFHFFRDYRLSMTQVSFSAQLANTRIVQALAASASLGDIWDAVRAFDWSVFPMQGYHPKHAADVNGEFLGWLPATGERPFFAFLNYMDAHQPYYSPHAIREQFTEGSELENYYDASIAYLDAQVDHLLGELQRRGRLRNTLVVIASDHGELFGEHGLYEHGNSLYLELLHVPLVMLLPGSSVSGMRVTQPVTLRDLPATVLDVVGIDQAAPFPGASLARHWRGTALGETPLLSEVRQGHNLPPSQPVSRGPMKSLLNERMHYILNGDGAEELYEYVSDPSEETNLAEAADSARFGPVLERFRADLTALLAPAR